MLKKSRTESGPRLIKEYTRTTYCRESRMEKMTINNHLKLQEMCDCYLETDFLSAMQDMAGTVSKEVEEDAIKYLALAIMYAITQKSEKLSLKKKGDDLKIKIKNFCDLMLVNDPVCRLD